MTNAKKRIGSLRRPSKEFPHCRQQIEREGWVPHILCDSAGMYWDGLTIADEHGRIRGPLSDSSRQEIITMILEGRFGEGVRDAVVDDASYWRVRDALITRRNPDKIRDESLAVLTIQVHPAPET